MLKLDPDDNDSEEDGLEKMKLNNTSTTSTPALNESTSTTGTSSFLNSSTGCLMQSFNESGTSGLNISSTPNYGNKIANYNAFNSSSANPPMMKVTISMKININVVLISVCFIGNINDTAKFKKFTSQLRYK